MKYIFIIVIFAVAAFGLLGCGDNGGGGPPHTCEFGNWTKKTAATCITAEVHVGVCSCGLMDTKTVGYPEPDAHVMQFTSGQVATCVDSGYGRYDCIYCEYFTEGPIAALGHDETGIAATCLLPKVCARSGCGFILTAALGHNWSNWAASSVWGMETQPCSRCTETSGLRMASDMLAQIPAGSVDMGLNFIAQLSAFRMGKYQVTQAQWQAVMGSNPSYFRAGGSGASSVTGLDTSRFPVEQVSWYEAIVFSNRLSILEGLTPAYEMETTTAGIWSTNPDLWGEVPLRVIWNEPHPNEARWDNVQMVAGSTGYRLPTEAQWEYAARAGSIGDYSININGVEVTGANLAEHAWFSANSGSRTHQVGTRIANDFGLFDMHGNVAEWVWDRWGIYSPGTFHNPTGPVVGAFRVFRGGDWKSLAEFTRSYIRFSGVTDSGLNFRGFRVARPAADP